MVLRMSNVSQKPQAHHVYEVDGLHHAFPGQRPIFDRTTMETMVNKIFLPTASNVSQFPLKVPQLRVKNARLEQMHKRSQFSIFPLADKAKYMSPVNFYNHCFILGRAVSDQICPSCG